MPTVIRRNKLFSDCCHASVREFVGLEGGMYYECDLCHQWGTADYIRLTPMDREGDPLSEEAWQDILELRAANELLWYQRAFHFG